MEISRYPEDYLSKRGNIKYCWGVHVKKMKKIGQPYVDYNSFYSRIKRMGWDLYRAINTPLDYKKLEWYEYLRVWVRTQRFQLIYKVKRFIYLFK